MATKHLYVLRHAKSSWDDPGLGDHDRPLSPRGRKAAAVIAEHLLASGVQPELVLCSSARRAVETLEGADPSGERVIEPELYGASVDGLIERLRRVPEDVGSVMLVGHNPALQNLLVLLAAGGSGLSAVQDKFPTAALATLTVECAWSELGPGSARLVSFMRPKQLSRSSRT